MPEHPDTLIWVAGIEPALVYQNKILAFVFLNGSPLLVGVVPREL